MSLSTRHDKTLQHKCRLIWGWTMDLCILERWFGWGGLFTVCRQEGSSSMGWSEMRKDRLGGLINGLLHLKVLRWGYACIVRFAWCTYSFFRVSYAKRMQ